MFSPEHEQLFIELGESFDYTYFTNKCVERGLMKLDMNNFAMGAGLYKVAVAEGIPTRSIWKMLLPEHTKVLSSCGGCGGGKLL